MTLVDIDIHHRRCHNGCCCTIVVQHLREEKTVLEGIQVDIEVQMHLGVARMVQEAQKLLREGQYIRAFEQLQSTDKYLQELYEACNVH